MQLYKNKLQVYRSCLSGCLLTHPAEGCRGVFRRFVKHTHAAALPVAPSLERGTFDCLFYNFNMLKILAELKL
jgi:hypothetical protein